MGGSSRALAIAGVILLGGVVLAVLAPALRGIAQDREAAAFAVSAPGGHDPSVLERLDAEIGEIVAQARESVVQIRATERYRLPGKSLDVRMNYAGIIVDASGLIVTVAQAANARSLTVVLPDGAVVDAETYAVDAASDTALLKVDAEGHVLTPVRWGRSADVRLGSSVIVLGNPFGLRGSMARGTITGTDRLLRVSNWPTLALQTDADINPGDPGGLAVNRHGEMIGMLWSTFGETAAGRRPPRLPEPRTRSDFPEHSPNPQSESEEAMRAMIREFLGSLDARGIGFIMEADVLRHVVDDLIEFREVRRARVGLQVRHLRSGVVVTWVDPTGPTAGSLECGDVLVSFGTSPIRSLVDIYRALLAREPGEVMPVVVRRAGEERVFAVTLGMFVPRGAAGDSREENSDGDGSEDAPGDGHGDEREDREGDEREDGTDRSPDDSNAPGDSG